MRILQNILIVFALFFINTSVFAEDTLEQDLAIANRISKAFAKVAEKSFPSVVVIENIQKPRGLMGSQLPPELEFFFGRQRNMRPSDNKPRAVGFGSGVIIRENGYVVTNQHVIKDAEFLRVKLQDGTVYDNQVDKNAVKIIGVDEQSDVAVLRLSEGKKTFKALAFANSDDVVIGDWSIAVGAPFNYDYTMTVGVVSQKGRHNGAKSPVANYIQTDASINPGNSGGPLLNIKGEIIGINNFIVNGGGVAANAGLGFAISSNIVKNVADQLIDTGKVNRPWLGISMTELTPEDRKNYSIEKGVLVREVLKDNPADKAGLKSEDVILKVGNEECNTVYDVQKAVLKHKSGEVITLTVLRDQKEKVIKVTSSLRDDKQDVVSSENTEESSPADALGLTLKETDKGLYVQAVEEGSEASEKGIKAGTKIISVNRKDVAKVRDFEKIIKDFKGENVMLKLSDENREFIEFLKVS